MSTVTHTSTLAHAPSAVLLWPAASSKTCTGKKAFDCGIGQTPFAIENITYLCSRHTPSESILGTPHFTGTKLFTSTVDYEPCSQHNTVPKHAYTGNSPLRMVSVLPCDYIGLSPCVVPIYCDCCNTNIGELSASAGYICVIVGIIRVAYIALQLTGLWQPQVHSHECLPKQTTRWRHLVLALVYIDSSLCLPWVRLQL